MPELPEVEALRRGLVSAILGQRIKSIEIRRPKLVSGKGNARAASAAKTKEFIQGLTGEKIEKIERRAKNLIFYFSHHKVLLVHLKMTGQLVYIPQRLNAKRSSLNANRVIGGHPIELSEKELPNKHTHLIFTLTKGVLYYNDTRMFGYLLYYPGVDAFEGENHFAALGHEPHEKEFTLAYFGEALKGKNGILKKVLMDQAVVTGLGNIYADEVCFEAGVRPNRKVSSLKREEVEKLYKAIRRIIPEAIKQGGSSVANYLLADGSRGNYARSHKVYGKSGKPCGVCGTSLLTVIMNGRTTVYCRKCQK